MELHRLPLTVMPVLTQVHTSPKFGDN